MNRKVEISKTAEKKLDKLFGYLIDEWSVDVKNEFAGKLNNCLIKLSDNNLKRFPNPIKKKD